MDSIALISRQLKHDTRPQQMIDHLIAISYAVHRKAGISAERLAKVSPFAESSVFLEERYQKEVDSDYTNVI